MPQPITLDRLLRRQHALVTRSQLRDAGLSAGRLKAELKGRRWQSINEKVVCLHNGPLTRRQQLWAVLLSAPPHAALGSFTVLEMHRIKGFGTDAVHVLVRKGDKVLAVPRVDVAVHEIRRFPIDEIRLFDDLRVTLPPRAFVDAATHSRDEFTAARILVAGVQQARIAPALLREELLDAPRARHRRLLLLLANDLEGGAQALSETEFLAFCRRHGFPRPRLQVRFDSAGRRRYLDAEFRASDGACFWVEVDGGIHLKLEVRARDNIKDNDATIRGRTVLRYASVSIYRDDPDAIRQIGHLLRGGGPPWQTSDPGSLIAT